MKIKKYLKYLAIPAGAILGFSYYYFIGCQSGTCPIQSNPYYSTLYGALLEAAIYMKVEVDMITMYKAKYDEAMGELIRLCNALERGDAYRDGQTKLNANIKGNTVT